MRTIMNKLHYTNHSELSGGAPELQNNIFAVPDWGRC